MMQKIISFYDGYINNLTEVNPRHQWVFNSINKWIPVDTKVLDIGCGTGITSRYLAHGNRKVTAIDISPVLIEYAKTYNSHFGSVKYITSDIKDCEFTEKFDAVLMVDVLEHLLSDSLTYLFNTLYEITHKDSRIYVNIPSSDLARYLIENHPKNRQIVDNTIETGNLIRMFHDIGFVPVYYHMYWGQYIEFLFITEPNYHNQLDKAFK